MKNIKNIFILKLLIFLACVLVFEVASLTAKSKKIDKDEDIYIDYETRLKFYLDLKTKNFLKKMSLKEQMLIDMIHTITGEIKARGKSGITTDDAGFDKIYGESESILQQYEQEIYSIKQIINDLEKLELTIQRIDDLKLLEEVEELKLHLKKTLDEQKLAGKLATKQQAAKMIEDYSDEMNRILRIYDEIDLFQKRANSYGDMEIVHQLDQQKQRVIKILEESRIASTDPDKVVESYIEEAVSIVEILKQIDLLSEQTSSDTTLNLDINEVRNGIISNLDNRILQLFGYMENENFTGTTVSDYFRTWKAERISEYQTIYTKYRIIRDNLIKSSNSEERNRMLEREVTNALLNYANQQYEIAEMQFDQIYSAYKEYYANLDGVIFYESEANFANYYYDSAQEGYLQIINQYPDSQFLGQSYLRLMIINYTYGWFTEFFKYFDKVKQIQDINVEDLNKAYYLAGYLHSRQNQYLDAQNVLETIKENSKYYVPAQYLLGIVLINLEKYTRAQKIFEQLIDQKNYPWTDLNFAIIKNESLLKLGYLHYQKGEYDRAIFYFDQVSKGYDGYDSSLLGQAWANLKQGKYHDAINNVDLICNNYLVSNYSYEALVVSAHCKRIQNRTDEALKDFQYVANAKHVLGKVHEYNDERERILKQLDELEQLEATILERQDKDLYPQVVKIRDLINDALKAFRYRGTVSSRLLEEYNDERKVLIRQIEEFDEIIKFAEEQGNKELLADATTQRNRLVSVLEKYQLEHTTTGMSYFVDYPLATKEGSLIYRRGIVNKLVGELIFEKQRVQKDLEMVAELISLSDEQTRMDAIIDLEIIEEDLKELNNQLNQFQVWLSKHEVEDVKTETEQWADFSGVGMSDINFVSYRERIEKIGSYSKNLINIAEVLEQKKQQLENRIRRFDNEVRKIQSEMETEKIRLEKLEREKYFQEIYFETKTREIETEEIEKIDDLNWLINQKSGKKL